MGNNKDAVKNRVKKDNEKVKGAAQFFQQEDTSINNESNMERESSNTSDIAITSSTESENSVNVSTNVSGIPRKAKYLDTRVQRSYYLNKELVKELDKYAKKNDYDKSDIVNWILKEFLYNNGKL